ncbi:hypothetical protein ACHQM5_006570 [Ranunculus cassubicifolius]
MKNTQQEQRKNKRQKTHGSSKTSAPTRPWKDLDKDILLRIFQQLDLKDRIKGAPLCCSSWYNISKDPSMWREVNLNQFDLPDSSTQLIEFVINRSQQSLTSISFSSNARVDDLLLVAERCPNLKYFELRIHEDKIHEGKKAIEKVISKLKLLEGMAVNEVLISDDTTLEQISRYCPNFMKLKAYDALSHKTASLIVKFLPKLKILDVSRTKIYRKNLLVILKGCQELENVDLTRCGKILNSDEILKIGCGRIKEFKWDKDVKEESCSECEEEYEEKYGDDDSYCFEDYSYRWPCDHVIDTCYITYIEGTYDLTYEINPPAQVEGTWADDYDNYMALCADDGASDDYDYDNYDWSCECECGRSSHSEKKHAVRDQYDYSYL